jgi:hypothetical protein
VKSRSTDNGQYRIIIPRVPTNKFFPSAGAFKSGLATAPATYLAPLPEGSIGRRISDGVRVTGRNAGRRCSSSANPLF